VGRQCASAKRNRIDERRDEQPKKGLWDGAFLTGSDSAKKRPAPAERLTFYLIGTIGCLGILSG